MKVPTAGALITGHHHHHRERHLKEAGSRPPRSKPPQLIRFPGSVSFDLIRPLDHFFQGFEVRAAQRTPGADPSL